MPRGSRVPVTITAFRHDGFDGPIDVELTGLPAGLRATSGVILPGHSQVAVTLEAPRRRVGRDAARSACAARRASAAGGDAHGRPHAQLPLVSVTEPPPVRVASVEPAVIELRRASRRRCACKIARGNGFTGRVPVSVLNLPLLLTVPDIGLNGILITEQQDSREFTIVADPRPRRSSRRSTSRRAPR